MSMTKLDEIALSIELVLISLIEGVALVSLAGQAVLVFQEPDWYRYVAFVLAGLAILLVFWAQSIMHAISFIRWPVRLEHMFLYFGAALLQIVAYSSIFNIFMWFVWWTAFSAFVIGMYFLDLQVIQESLPRFTKMRGGEKFLRDVEERHFYEMKYLVPAAVVFNVFMLVIIYVFPKAFHDAWAYAIPGTLQLAFSSYALYDVIKNYRTRSTMLAGLFSEEKTS